MRKLGFLVFVLAASQLGSTECGQVISDRGFDVWCGDRLCAWELEKGEIRPAPTWHEGDTGVELVGLDTAISQLAPAETSDGHCIRVTLVADVEESAEVRLQIDVYGDGTIESDDRIPTSDWRKLTYLMRLPDLYERVRFRLTKTGPGRAVLANIGAEIEIDEACMGEPLIVQAPVGAECTDDAACASGDCYEWPDDWPDICGTCDDDSDCSNGDLCTVGLPSPAHLSIASHCMAPGVMLEGERCLRDASCASGMCVFGVCSLCREAADCGGSACISDGPWLPMRCDGGRASGAPCFVHAGCDSGVCEGEPLLGCDGSLARPCDSEDDCPSELTNPDAISCATVGFAGGTCR